MDSTTDNETGAPPLWRVSLHGGHSGDFCDHAVGTLRDVLQAAVDAGYHTFGVSEHAPRIGARYLYEEELRRGWDVAKLEAMFDAYFETLVPLIDEFSDRLVVLRGFEAEVVPASYAELTMRWREQYRVDYIVGSVHHVHDSIIDGPRSDFEAALKEAGSIESLAVDYYAALAQMIRDLRPEVVGHFDLIRKNGVHYGLAIDAPLTQRVHDAATDAMQAAAEAGCILDLNTAGLRKGQGIPYPAPWLLEVAKDHSVPFCLGDDSHGPADVGAGLDESRRYLQSNGIQTVTVLTRENHSIVRRVATLPADSNTT